MCNLSGHMHLQHILSSPENFMEIATSSLARSPAQYGKATYDGAILEYQTCQTDVAGWALEHTETDPDLLQFPEYAYNFMYQTVKEKRLSPCLALREQQPSSFYTDHIKSILKNERSDHHHILSGYR